MSSFFKKYQSKDKKDIVLYKNILMDLIKEIELNYVGLIERSTDILNLEYMEESFLIEWLSFYGLELPKKNVDTYNRNSLKRWRFFLRHRGEEQTLYSVLSSGGALFNYNEYPIRLFWWDNVPAWIEQNPKDGYIYVLCEDRDVIKKNDLIDSIKPAGYVFDLVYNDPKMNIGVWPYYGDLRFDYGLINGQLQPTEQGTQQGSHPNEFLLYKHDIDTEKYAEGGTVYGNFGSEDYNNIKEVTLDQEGFLNQWTRFSVPSGYPEEFDAQGNSLERRTLSVEELVEHFGQNIKYEKDGEGQFVIPSGSFSNRTTVVSRENLYFVSNGYTEDGTVGDGTISPRITNVNDYVKNINFELKTFENLPMWESSEIISSEEERSISISVPYNTRLDKKVKINFCFEYESDPVNFDLKFYVNGLLQEEVVKQGETENPPLENNYYGSVILECDGISEPISEIKIEYIRDISLDGKMYIDLREVELRKSIIEYESQKSSETDVIKKENIVFPRNWSFETLWRNNLSVENLYYQYEEKILNSNEEEIDNDRYNPPQLGVQPEKLEDNVYKYIKKGETSPAPVLIGLVSSANDISTEDATEVVNAYWEAPGVVTEDLSILGSLTDSTWVAKVLSEQNYDNYMEVQANWPYSYLPNGPSTSKWWPVENLMAGIMHHWSFGDTSSYDGSDSVETNPVTLTSSYFTSETGKIDSCAKFGGAYTYAEATIERIVDIDKEWTVSFWVKINASTTYYLNVVSISNSDFSKYISFGINKHDNVNMWTVATKLPTRDESYTNIQTTPFSWVLINVTHKANENYVSFYVNNNNPITVNLPSDLQTIGENKIRVCYGGVSGLSGLEGAGSSLFDEFSIWNRELSQEEITKLYNNGNGLAYEDWNSDQPPTPVPVVDSTLLNGLQAFYTFAGEDGDQTLVDVSGNERNITSQTSSFVIDSTYGKVGSGVGTTEVLTSTLYTNESAGESINSTDGTWTLATWLNAANYSLASSRATVSLSDFGLAFYNPGAGGVRLWDSTSSSSWWTNNERASFTTDDLNTWVHLAMVYTGENKVEVYKNGELATVTTVNGRLWRDQKIRLGNNFNSANYTLTNGKLDEVGVWTRALSCTEIKALYDAGNDNKTYPFEQISPEDQAVNLKWKCASHFDFGSTSFSSASSVPGDKSYLGQFMSSAAFTTEGKLGGGVNLPNNDSHLQFANNAQNNRQTFGKGTSQSFSLWFKPTAITTGKNHNLFAQLGKILKPVAGAINSSTVFVGITEQLKPCIFTWSGNQEYYSLISDNSITLDEWHHIVVAFDAPNKTISLYIDGQLFAEDTNLYEGWAANDDLIFQADNPVIGYSYSSKNSYDGVCIGIADELSWWDGRCLKASDVTVLYNNGNGLEYDKWPSEPIPEMEDDTVPDTITLKNDILTYYNFEPDFVSGTTVYDVTGNQKDLNLVSLQVGQNKGIIGSGAYRETNSGILGGFLDNTFLTTGNEWSMSFWIWRKESANVTTIGKRDGAVGYTVTINANNFVLAEGTYSSKIINSGCMKHIVCVIKNGNRKIYIDGELNMYANGTTYNLQFETFLGQYSSTNTGPYIMNIDEFGLWDRELTASEVKALFWAGRHGLSYPFDNSAPQPVPPSPTPLPTPPAGTYNFYTGLTHHWSFGNSTTWDGASSVEGDTVVLTNNSSAAYPAFPISKGLIKTCAFIGSTSANCPQVSSAINGIGTQNYTANIWFNKLANEANNNNNIMAAATLGDQPNGGGWMGFGIGRSSGGVNNVPAFGYGYSSFTFKVTGTTAITSGWHMLTVTLDVANSLVSLYLDGVLVGSDTAPADLLAGTSSTTKCGLGRVGTTAGCASIMVGLMDEFSIWENRCLTASEIATLYNNGKGIAFENWNSNS